jgi:hypothetical protein
MLTDKKSSDYIHQKVLQGWKYTAPARDAPSIDTVEFQFKPVFAGHLD